MQMTSFLRKIMESNMSQERKNIFWGNSAIHGACYALGSLKEQGHTMFRVTYKVRRRSGKFDIITYKSYDEAVKGITDHVHEVGGEAKIADVTVSPVDVFDTALDGLHKTIMKEARKQKQKQEDNPYLYKPISVRDIVNFIKANKETFPNGLDTQIICGDDECNHTYQNFGFQQMTVSDDGGKALVIAYDLHDTMF